MPLHDFECRACGHVTEHLVKISTRDEPQKCEQCSETNSLRVSVNKGTGFQLKGEGWYSDGYQPKGTD
jgi:putative FmdB family regulatory protein